MHTMLQICIFIKQCYCPAMYSLYQCPWEPAVRKTIWPALFRIHVKVTTAKPRHCNALLWKTIQHHSFNVLSSSRPLLVEKDSGCTKVVISISTEGVPWMMKKQRNKKTKKSHKHEIDQSTDISVMNNSAYLWKNLDYGQAKLKIHGTW